MGRSARHELDKMIVQILEYRKSLRYTKLYEEVNRIGEKKKPSSPIYGRLVAIHKPEVQWKKPPNSTFDRRLGNLEHRGVLHKPYKGRNTPYSLTEGFKYSLDKHRKKYPTTYVETALQEFRTIQYKPGLESDDENAIEIIKPSENEESSEDN